MRNGAVKRLQLRHHALRLLFIAHQQRVKVQRSGVIDQLLHRHRRRGVIQKHQVAIKRQKVFFQRVLVAQQHLVGKAAALRMNQRNLPSPLANQIVTGGFGGESMIELNTVVAFAIEAVHQHHVRAVNIQRKTRADD
ncbi:Uncharacterised protein [Klebsiella pneumoniae]|nr:Uncharacterised protein [Klebsiella pneumoniae]